MMIIDFHTHTFPDKICPQVVENLGMKSRTVHFTDGSKDGLLASMREGGVTHAVNLPVMTSPAQVEKIHDGVIRSQEALEKEGIISFGGMHPDYENYRAEIRRLRENGIRGIKIHPAYQNTDFDDDRYLHIMDAAAEEDLIVLTHAGIDIGIYDRNYCSVEQILRVLRIIQPPKLVLAHMGNWACWDEVEQDLAGAPLWFDTAFAHGSITPNPNCEEPPYLSSNLSDEDFLRICKKHGLGKILFGTDSPWLDHKNPVERIRALSFTEEEKEMIFCRNAKKLLKME